MHKKIVLFDLDGTLTEPRQNISCEMQEALLRLMNYVEVGVITGSGFDYIKEQIPFLTHSKYEFEINDFFYDKLHILACNGTQYFKREFHKNNNDETYHEWSIKHKADMRKVIGSDTYNALLKKLFELQIDFAKTHSSLPMTGEFFSYRGSMLNWCPIGRSAGKDEREKLLSYNEYIKNDIRIHYLDELQNFISSSMTNITAVLGGQTSFDIYPSGWDKTYGMRLMRNLGYKVYFVGDKCVKNGNDQTIYKACLPNAWEVSGLDETIKLIDNMCEKKFQLNVP